MVRDFTYIDDIIESLVRLLEKPAAADPGFDPTNPDSATIWASQWVFTSATPIRSCRCSLAIYSVCELVPRVLQHLRQFLNHQLLLSGTHPAPDDHISS
jgi:hypothetical protein